MTSIATKSALQLAREEEILRGQQLLMAAQRRYDGEMDEEEFNGFVCRYGHACFSRRLLHHDLTTAAAARANLN